MKKKKLKITLGRETIKLLGNIHLEDVAGGWTGVQCTGTDGPGCRTACALSYCLCTAKNTTCG